MGILNIAFSSTLSEEAPPPLHGLIDCIESNGQKCKWSNARRWKREHGENG